ncbi:hypothetical protein PC123_g8765 [Phytophthora cactorum]|nr:hypothetical protein PC123_g8765 [Phytophthora cactorum]
MEYDTDSEKERNYDWQMVVLSDQVSYIRSRLSQTSLRGYLESLRVSFNDENLPVAWKRLEAHYRQSNAQGMVALIAEFVEVPAMDFASVEEPIVRVKETRNRINRQSRENLKGVIMIPNQYAAVKVLSLFPTHSWGNRVDCSNECFHLDKVEALLRNVFMDKCRGQIEAVQDQAVPVSYAASNRPLGKRKERAEEPKKKKGGECSYWDGRYNRDGQSHYKADWSIRAKARSQGFLRNSIFVKGKKVDGLSKPVGVAHVKGEKKGTRKAKAKREEIPAEVSLLQPISKLNIVEAVNATQASGSSALIVKQAKHDTDELMTSPPVSPTPPSSLSSDNEDTIKDFVQGSVPAHAAKMTEASGNIKEASRAVENTVRDLYPELMERNVADITRSDWVLPWLWLRSNGRRVTVCARADKQGV